MNGPDHPPVDRLADHHEGLLAGDAQATVQSHLAGCSDCQRLLAQLDDVPQLLADEGSRPVTMPSSVAARLEGALAEEAAKRTDRSAHQGDDQPRAAVSSLTSRRAPGARSAHRRVWPVLAAAAAVVVVSAVGIEVMQGQGQSADTAASGGGGADDTLQEGGDAAAPEKGDAPTEGTLGSKTPSFRGTGPASVAALTALARDLAQGNPRPALSVGDVCVTKSAEDFAADTGPVSLIRWQGRAAILEVDVARHRLVVLDCLTPGRRLFTTTY
ncbi:MAG: hypothetical protein H0U61_01725 [Nocardioidaceae bacterium]|nr:hypothetical protein [Nocardioidaceae bacterium]